jgi:hypothetical protein
MCHFCHSCCGRATRRSRGSQLRKRTKPVLLVAAALAGSALAFMQSNRGPWSTDPGVGLAAKANPSQTQIELTKDHGDLACWIRVRIPLGRLLSVSVDDGHKLSISRDGTWWRITEPAGQPATRAQFMWYAGGRMLIRGSRLELLDWELYRADGPMDSAAKERRRRIFFAVSVALGVVGAVAGALLAFLIQDPPPPPFTPDHCVLLLIGTLEAKRPEDTERMRDLLVRALQTKSVSRLNVRPRERGLLKQGIDQLAEHLDYLIDALAAKRRRLG